MNTILNSDITMQIQGFFASINYDELFIWVPLILLCICVLSRFLCLLLTFCSPKKFGMEHRKIMSKTSRSCYLLSIFAQILVWVWGSTNQVSLLGKADIMTAAILILLAVIAFFFATIGMLLSRKGKRVFISKSLYFQAVMLILFGAFIGCFGWIFMI